MRKFILAICVIAAAAFAGCSKDEHSGGNSGNGGSSSSSLSGTTWVYNGSFYDSDGLNVETETITFNSSSSFSCKYSVTYSGRTETSSCSGSYTRSDSVIKLSGYWGANVTGSINTGAGMINLYDAAGNHFGPFYKK